MNGRSLNLMLVLVLVLVLASCAGGGGTEGIPDARVDATTDSAIGADAIHDLSADHSSDLPPGEDTKEPEDTVPMDLELNDLLPLEDTIPDIETPPDTETPQDTIPDVPPSELGELWGVWHDGSHGHLIRFDIGDPNSYEMVKSTSWILFTEVEFDGDGNLWAWNNKNGFSGGELYLVDQDTGDFQYIGDTDISLDDLAWNPVDQQMYGVHPWSIYTQQVSQLYTVDLQTGATTLVGNIVDDGPLGINWMSGLGIDSTGNFYFYNNAAEAPITEQGIWKSTTPGGLEVELLLDLSEALEEPAGAFQVGPVFVDWSRDDGGYASVRYSPYGSTTHTYHLIFDDDAVLDHWKLDDQYGTIWGITRSPAEL